MRLAERQKISQQIESNDPKLERVSIQYHECHGHEHWEEFWPPDDDWKREGDSIGRNKHIKTLCLKRIGLRGGEMEDFCGRLACNKSITRLELYRCGAWGGSIFDFLSPFLQQNSNLSCLMVDFDATTGSISNGIKILTTILSKFNTLRKFECHRAEKLDDEDLGKLIRVLANHCQLTDINFNRFILRKKGIAALASLLENPQLCMRKLRLNLNDEGAAVLANALGENSTLHELDLGSNENVTVEGWQTFCAHVDLCSSSLVSLNLEGNSIDDGFASVISNALTSGSKLTCLNLCQNPNIHEGWRDAFNALRSPSCLLEELDISGNTLDDNLVTHLAHSLANNRVLRRLFLRDNYQVSESGWEPLSNVFREPTALEKVDMESNSYTGDVLISFANSLMTNNKLKGLYLDGGVDIEASAWDFFSRSLCNQSSVADTYNSNHTLQSLFDPNAAWIDDDGNDVDSPPSFPPRLTSLLQINKENSRGEAARRKIFMVHFTGDFSLQPFFDMNLKALPQAVAWMAKDDPGLSLLYQYVRNSSVFIDVGSGVKKDERELVSKRQKFCDTREL